MSFHFGSNIVLIEQLQLALLYDLTSVIIDYYRHNYLNLSHMGLEAME